MTGRVHPAYWSPGAAGPVLRRCGGCRYLKSRCRCADGGRPAPGSRAGIPLSARSLPELTADELALFRAKIAPGGCGLAWTALVRGNGTGVFHVRRNGRQVKVSAHRLAWKLATGTDPGGLAVVTACGNPACMTESCLTAQTPGDIRRRVAQQGKAA